MKTENELQLIEDYLDGLLTGEKLEAFNKKIETDTAFAKAFEERKKLERLWKAAEEYRQTKDRVVAIIKKEHNAPLHLLRKYYYIWAFAASVVLLLAVYFLLIRQNGSLPFKEEKQLAVTDTFAIHKEKPQQFAKLTLLIQPVSPLSGDTFTTGDSLIFRWKIPDIKREIPFKIINNTTGRTVMDTTVPLPDSLLILPPGRLNAGTYLWYMIDTLKINTFTVKKK